MILITGTNSSHQTAKKTEWIVIYFCFLRINLPVICSLVQTETFYNLTVPDNKLDYRRITPVNLKSKLWFTNQRERNKHITSLCKSDQRFLAVAKSLLLWQMDVLKSFEWNKSLCVSTIYLYITLCKMNLLCAFISISSC